MADVEGLIEAPVRQLKRFLKFIAEQDMWDELEQHLKDQGCDRLCMNFEPVKAIGEIVQTRASKLEGEHWKDSLRCGCGDDDGPPEPGDGGLPPGGAPRCGC